MAFITLYLVVAVSGECLNYAILMALVPGSRTRGRIALHVRERGRGAQSTYSVVRFQDGIR